MAIRNDGLVRGKHIGKGLTVDETRKKIDVDLTEFVDGESVILTGGKLKVPNKPCKRINNLNTLAGITEIGVTCITGVFNKNDAFVPGFPNIQGADVEATRAATAEEYLSNVANIDWTGLVTATDNEVIVHISVYDQHYMSMNDAGMNDNGTLKDSTHWTPWQRVDNVPQAPQAPQSSGLDCAAIDQLPEVSWKKDTVVLAKQDGRCVRLKATGDIFTDVVLNLTTAKTSTSIVTGTTETINLVAQVQNAGTNPATAIRLVLTKPVLGTYTMGTPEMQSQGATGFAKVSDTEYTIATLNSGGVATVTISVTYSKQGAFTFGGQVTSTIDTDTKNNSKTVTVSVTERPTATGGNYVPTQDCPLFTITDLQYDKQLFTFGEDTPQNTYDLIRAGTSKINIYADKRGLAGRRFRLENAEQVVCVSSSSDSRYSSSRNLSSSSSSSYSSYSSSYSYSSHSIYSSSSSSRSNSSISSGSVDLTSDIIIHRDFSLDFTNDLYTSRWQHIIPTSAYTYNKRTGELVFNSSFTNDHKSSVDATNVGALVMYVKPKGDNCKWQCCVIKFSAAFPEEHPTTKVITHSSNLNNNNVAFNYSSIDVSNWYIEPDIDKKANWIGGELPEGLNAFRETSVGAGISRSLDTNDSVVVIIKKGTNGTFTLTATDNRLAIVQTRGNIDTSYNAGNKTLTVTLANPQPQNSIKFPKVEFKVID